MSDRHPQCKARRMNDQMICGRCGLQWDLDDTDAPDCGLKKETKNVQQEERDEHPSVQ